MADLQQPTKSHRLLAGIANKRINRIHNAPVSHANEQHRGRAVEAAIGFLERAIAKLQETPETDRGNLKKADAMLERAIRKFRRRPDYDDEHEMPLDGVADFLDKTNVTSFLPENITDGPLSKKYPPSGDRRRGRHSG